jgi:hypothetical protein
MLSAPTVLTDAVLSSEAELNEAAAAFLGAGPFEFQKTEVRNPHRSMAALVPHQNTSPQQV